MCTRRGERPDDDDSRPVELPEDAVLMIFDQLPLRAAVCLSRLCKSILRYVQQSRIDAVRRLTTPPFSLPWSDLLRCTKLSLFYSNISDDDVTALANACAKGALANLNQLWLLHNKIDDAGAIALADGCAKGALARLTVRELLTAFTPAPDGT